MYDSREGEKRVSLDVIASELVVVDRNPDGGGAPRAPRPAAEAPAGATSDEGGSQAAPSDLDDLPF